MFGWDSNKENCSTLIEAKVGQEVDKLLLETAYLVDNLKTLPHCQVHYFNLFLNFIRLCPATQDLDSGQK